ncbi:MAG: D-aminoacyl-tRNA deacylase [Clostridia bacterium]|nr:D-aminoacyl-tRNA deacylase [Clostridia bacterium]
MQRATSAEIEVIGKYKASIGRGILVLCAFCADDTPQKIKWAAGRISKLRIFQDDNGKLNRSAIDEGGEALVVSNFTLYGDCLHGTRPNFSKSAPAEISRPMYDLFVAELSKLLPVKTGEFGGKMALSIIADGPSTVVMDN